MLRQPPLGSSFFLSSGMPSTRHLGGDGSSVSSCAARNWSLLHLDIDVERTETSTLYAARQRILPRTANSGERFAHIYRRAP